MCLAIFPKKANSLAPQINLEVCCTRVAYATFPSQVEVNSSRVAYVRCHWQANARLELELQISMLIMKNFAPVGYLSFWKRGCSAKLSVHPWESAWDRYFYEKSLKNNTEILIICLHWFYSLTNITTDLFVSAVQNWNNLFRLQKPRSYIRRTDSTITKAFRKCWAGFQ